jgi:hypothetical protein
MSNWTELKTLQDIAAAHVRGDEIEVFGLDGDWVVWSGGSWCAGNPYRSRPRKRTKTVVLREFLAAGPYGRHYHWTDTPKNVEHMEWFVRWTGNERIEEVEE